MKVTHSINNQRGQLLVEYVLILIILILVASTIVGQLVGKSESPGMVISAWVNVQKVIGDDLPDVVPQGN